MTQPTNMIAALLETDAAQSSAALLLRPWRAADTADLVELHRDDSLRRRTSSGIDDEVGAARWVREQQRGWETGDRFAFAVVEPEAAGGEGRLVGHIVLKGVAREAPTAEVGYWTAACARGRGVASRALRTLTDWAFTTFARDGLTRLELLHQVDNTASCRVAHKCRHILTEPLPAAPPAYPLNGYLHARNL
ncbi:GNAT family N-acetyltransferase [Streptomyces sp. NPDC001852]|uniref:GNAT family N-acetyltransferase n=1 Tax=Streptomyces sp. NPDC001852 TaxID=3364619 RepID=UPI00367B376B